MSRVTAPTKQLARSLNSASAAARPSNSLLEHNAGATLMPKYADLLRNRRSAEHTDSSRGLTTTHRPTPQPSIANRNKPLMQTFHTSPISTASTASHLDATVLPSMDALHAIQTPTLPRMPIVPDNASGYSTLEAAASEAALSGEATILAADPEKVSPSAPFSEVDTVGLDGVELKFVHESAASESSQEFEGGMLRDLWKGMVEDVLGQPPAKKAI